MQTRASGFYLTVLGLIALCAGLASAVFGTLYAFDQGHVPPGYTYLAFAAAAAAGIILTMPGLGLLWMADVIKDLGAVRGELARQARATANLSAVLEDALLGEPEPMRDPHGANYGRANGRQRAPAPSRASRSSAGQWGASDLDDFDRI